MVPDIVWAVVRGYRQRLIGATRASGVRELAAIGSVGMARGYAHFDLASGVTTHLSLIVQISDTAQHRVGCGIALLREQRLQLV
jgi:hypothetical protein